MILLAFLLLLADTPIGFTPDAVAWKDGPPTLPAGSKIAVLEGDPRADGMFTMRVRVPAGAALAPHWHPRHERVTILSGAADLGFGSTADPAKTTRYGAGSFYVNPPRVMHYLYFPEETVMQMTGVGPWELHTTDVEAKAQAEGTLIVRSVKPAVGSELTPSSKIEVTVDYEIQNFRPDTFHLSIQFESTTPNQTFSAVVTRSTATPPIPPALTAASGTKTVSANFADIARHASLKHPVRVKVYLHEATGEMTSRVVATTDWIEFK
jgi:hypothetical protein